MEGGCIVQAGTVADIVLRPADRYVSDFVRHINPLDALRAETYMVRGSNPRRVTLQTDGRPPAGRDGRAFTASRSGRGGR